jgi:hypothetical protein
MEHHSVSVQARVAEKQGRYEGWLSDFDGLGVQFLVLGAERDSGLLELLQRHPQWMEEFSDGESVLYARTGAPVESGIMA